MTHDLSDFTAVYLVLEESRETFDKISANRSLVCVIRSTTFRENVGGDSNSMAVKRRCDDRHRCGGIRGVCTPCQEKTIFWYVISHQCYRPTRKNLADVPIFLSVRLSRASRVDSG